LVDGVLKVAVVVCDVGRDEGRKDELSSLGTEDVPQTVTVETTVDRTIEVVVAVIVVLGPATVTVVLAVDTTVFVDGTH
jgi:hypothetical protein